MQRTVHREMAITQADFFRLLPKALAGYKFEIAGTVIQVTIKTGSVMIHLESGVKRKIGALELPVLYITFSFDNFPQEEIINFFQKFDLTYQKGGG